MTIKGHLLLAKNIILFSVIFIIDINEFSYLELLISYILIVFGVIIVDIDEPESFIGRKLFFFSYPFKLINSIAKLFISILTSNKNIHKVFEHRGITHMLIFPIIIYLVSNNLEDKYSLFLKSFAVGIFLHQIGDIITNTGIRNYLFPLPIKNVKFFITFDTNSFSEKIINFILTIILFLQFIFVFNIFIGAK